MTEEKSIQFEDPTEGKEYPPQTKIWIRCQAFMAMLGRWIEEDELKQFIDDMQKCSRMISKGDASKYANGWEIRENSRVTIPVQNVWNIEDPSIDERGNPIFGNPVYQSFIDVYLEDKAEFDEYVATREKANKIESAPCQRQPQHNCAPHPPDECYSGCCHGCERCDHPPTVHDKLGRCTVCDIAGKWECHRDATLGEQVETVADLLLLDVPDGTIRYVTGESMLYIKRGPSWVDYDIECPSCGSKEKGIIPPWTTGPSCTDCEYHFNPPFDEYTATERR